MKTSTIKLRVQVRGIVEGNPPMLAFTKMLQRPDGKCKLHSQMAQVTDAALLERLRAEAHAGEEAAVVLETCLSSEGTSVVLKDFASVNAPAMVEAA